MKIVDFQIHRCRIPLDRPIGDSQVIFTEHFMTVLELKTDDVEEVTPSKVSLMPKDLLNQLNEDEVLDLIAYLLSRGNPQDPLFAQ